MSGNQDASTEAQERYWSLVEQRGEALSRLTRIESDIDQLLQEHKGQSFYVFRPEWVARALSCEVRPLRIAEGMERA